MSEITVEPFNQESWDQWQARGRASDIALADRLWMLALGIGSLALLTASLWTLS
jgi:hypothetical protein